MTKTLLETIGERFGKAVAEHEDKRLDYFFSGKKPPLCSQTRKKDGVRCTRLWDHVLAHRYETVQPTWVKAQKRKEREAKRERSA